MKLIVSLLFFMFVNTCPLFANESSDEKKESKALEEKKYSETDFREAVDREVSNKMKRLGDGNLVEFSRELMNKENDLKIKEMKQLKKIKELEVIKSELTKKISEFKSRQQRFLACLSEKDKKVSNRVNHMVDIISGMKPNKAAEVLSVQDPGISVEILGLLEPVKVSKIFNLMDKEISARLQKQYMTMKK